jgi:hypothetical protein
LRKRARSKIAKKKAAQINFLKGKQWRLLCRLGPAAYSPPSFNKAVPSHAFALSRTLIESMLARIVPHFFGRAITSHSHPVSSMMVWTHVQGAAVALLHSKGSNGASTSFNNAEIPFKYSHTE